MVPNGHKDGEACSKLSDSGAWMLVNVRGRYVVMIGDKTLLISND